MESLALLDAGYWEDVEVIVSDNASTDNTGEVVDRFGRTLPLRYFRNERNIGAEPNYFAAASYALAGYVWIFGDDDVFEEAAVASALQNIDQGYEQKRIAAAATGGILSSPGKQNGNSDSEVT